MCGIVSIMNQEKSFQKAALNPNTFLKWSVLSLNTYEIYWAWQMWEIVRVSEGVRYKFPSWARALVFPISSFWLFPKLQKITGSKTWPLAPVYWAVLYLVVGVAVGITGVSPVGDHVGWLIIAAIASALPLYPVVRALHTSTKKDRLIEHMPEHQNDALLGLLILLFLLSVLGFVSVWFGF